MPRLWSRCRPALIATAVLLTAAGGVLVTIHFERATRAALAAHQPFRVGEICVLYGLLSWLLAGCTIYLIADYGHHKRALAVAPPTGTAGCATAAPLLFLIPSYKEEDAVIRQSLVSAALVDYPDRRVVLLIDDPPDPTTPGDLHRLLASREIPASLQAAFDDAAGPFKAALRAFRKRQGAGASQPAAEVRRLVRLHGQAAGWILTHSPALAGLPSRARSHTDRLFLRKILQEPAREHRERAGQLARGRVTPEEIADEYERLASRFQVEFTSFERKQYDNLSHAPNKAMNLNSYIALVGKSFREVTRQGRRRLEPCAPSQASLRVRAAPYIATIDADSFITGDFARRLVPVMEAPGNERIAVAQTPYTAVPDPPVRLERTAAASTDVQFFNHQGMAHFGVSWWVGASALMRHAALVDIAVETEERGHPVSVYIQDRILIEDAAATIDLLRRGWRVHHDPGRLSYSATPPDFGALVIQRRRWSNGGLLILPSVVRYVLARPWSLGKIGEGLLRAQHLLSAAFCGVGLPILLFTRFDDSLVPPWIPLVGLPYFLVYGCDLVLAGYRWLDLPRLYALNTIVLIPVYLAGTVQSLRQALTGRLIPFKRTPKTADRTPAPLMYHLIVYAMVLFCAGCLVEDLIRGRYTHALFSFFNGAMGVYGSVVLIGLRSTWMDARLALRPAVARAPFRLGMGRPRASGQHEDRLAHHADAA